MSKTYGEFMVEVLREYNLSIVWYGSLDILHDFWNRKNPEKDHPHPLRVIQAVLNGVGRSNLFSRKNVLMEGHWVRFYKIKADE